MGAEQPLLGFLSACAVICGQNLSLVRVLLLVQSSFRNSAFMCCVETSRFQNSKCKDGGCFKINSIVL